jgi:hypothetical protein
MGRSILGVFAGVVIAMVLVALVEILGMRLIPFPAGVDPTDYAAIAEAIPSMPIGSFLFVLAAWWLGAGVGASTAVRIARSDARWPGLTVGGIILAATLYNLWIIPHPAWMAIAGVLGICVITFIASRPHGPVAVKGA